MVLTGLEEELRVFGWKDAEVGTGRQETWRKKNKEIYGCSERGLEVRRRWSEIVADDQLCM